MTLNAQKNLVKTYYVYMLLCSDSSFYVGITNDMERRLAEHQLGTDRRCYTFGRRPVTLVQCSDFGNVNDAIAWEKQLKGWSRSKKFALIESDWGRIHRLAECTNETRAASPFDSAQGDTACDAARAQADTA